MQDVVSAIYEVSDLPAYRQLVMSWAPEIARSNPGPVGVFMGFDFHLTDAGPKLIEVNTNAGGAFLNNLLARAQSSCCSPMDVQGEGVLSRNFPVDVVRMFEMEWRLQGRERPLHRIAIVDDQPEEQYLYPEFILARQMLTRAGYDAVIASPETLQFSGTELLHGGTAVDLVYNRLVDFPLEQPEHGALRQAYETRAVAVTPNPHSHALYADKQNLVILSNPEELARLGASARSLDVLRAVPRTTVLTTENAAELWTARRILFFKPMRGYGSKAVYRGDKITRGVFEQIVNGQYVAQAFAAPSERMMRIEGVPTPRKVDVRIYAYAGKALLGAARLYQGQTTNFRTPGGGFAPVFAV
jgi:glutathione synthase/RimK-type ligase-like ATP-grasp enzyme